MAPPLPLHLHFIVCRRLINGTASHQLRAVSTTIPLRSGQTRRLCTTPSSPEKSQAQQPPYPSKPPASLPIDGPSEEPNPLQNVPSTYGRTRVRKFKPEPLLRPIGLKAPPVLGVWEGRDTRTIEQKRKDFADYGKHLQRRKELVDEFARPYFLDWLHLEHERGKLWIAPPRPFRAEYALYFPNFCGRTLVKTEKQEQQTAALLNGKISVVAVCGSHWGEKQIDTFISPQANPELHELVDKSGGKAQIVCINIEENTAKAFLVWLFMYQLRKKFKEKDWNKYFLIQHQVTRQTREAVGLLNTKTGYVYLVDGESKIRWAASGDAHEDEKASLSMSLSKLLKEQEPKVALPLGAKPQPS